MNIPQMVGRALRPVERLSVADWADQNRVLPSTSAEAGRWRTDRTPYMREIMDCVSPGSDVRTVAFRKSAQVGGTELILNVIGHAMDVDPGPALIVQPTEDTARSWSEKRLRPMLESTPQLRDLFGPSKKNPRNKTMYKEFPGGFLRIGYSTSGVQLRSDAIRLLLLDEVNGYPDDVDGEGDPVELAIARTRTFTDRRTVIGVSTPTIEGHCRITRWFEEGDQRYYNVPCPHCERSFVLELPLLERTELGVQCRCPECQELIDESQKATMLARGEWVPTAESTDARMRSYHINALYAPSGWFSWADVLDAYDKAKASNDANALRVFFNTVLGLPYEDAGAEQVDYLTIYTRRDRDRPRGWVPTSVALLTAGADVQVDRIECEVVGWGRGLRSWSIDYFFLDGDPTQQDVWLQLDELLERAWPGEQGATYQISKMAIDSGFETQSVYQWAHRVGPRLAMPVKGASHTMPMLVAAPTPVEVNIRGKKIENGATVRRVNTELIKDHLKRWLELEASAAGEPTPQRWCDFPDYPEEWFQGLCGEKRQRKGSRVVWVPVPNVRNEPLDCRVYNIAAMHALGVDQWSEERWNRELATVKAASVAEAEVGTVISSSRAIVVEKDGTRRRRYYDSSYLKR